jgi:hypothetical protein
MGFGNTRYTYTHTIYMGFGNTRYTYTHTIYIYTLHTALAVVKDRVTGTYKQANTSTDNLANLIQTDQLKDTSSRNRDQIKDTGGAMSHDKMCARTASHA